MTDILLKSAFAIDVLNGLTATEKFLPSKYFYDTHGSAIFQQIMAMPEYYPTLCEKEILETRSAAILDRIGFREPFEIIEFGSGDGSKTMSLMKTFIDHGADFRYVPIDISEDILIALQQTVRTKLPGLTVKPVAGDYSEMTKVRGNVPALFLFLGGNIGNYTHDEAIDLLKSFSALMRNGDKLLIGIDLRKDPNVVKLAYDDPHGITEAFNKNLLTRINNELDADFDLERFGFYCHYDPISGAVSSYLFSRETQTITLGSLDQKVSFEKNELIWTELSQKFDYAEINALATSSGFSVIENFTDSKEYFADSLWQK